MGAKQKLDGQIKSWFSSLKNFISRNKITSGTEAHEGPIISTLAMPEITQAQTVSMPLPRKNWLDDIEISIPPDVAKSEFVIALLRVGSQDYDYVYFDGECDNSIPLRQVACKIATEASDNLQGDQSSLGSLGFSLIELAEYEKALKCFERQKELSPEDGSAWNNIAWCLMRLGRYGEALDACEKALQFLSEHSHVHHDYASILAGLGRLDEAAAVINNAISNIKPQAPQLHYLLADIMEKQGSIESAAAQWKRYLTLVETMPGHERAKWRIQNKLQKYGEKVSSRDAVRPRVDDPNILFNSLAVCHMLCLNQYMGLGRKAPELISRASKLKIGNFMESLLSQHIHIVNELSKKTRVLSKEYKEIISKHYVFLALSKLLQEKLIGVEDLLNTCLKINKSNAEAKALLQAYYVVKVMQGVSINEEYRLLKTAIKIDPCPGHAQILLARHYCLKKKYGEIEEILSQVNKAERNLRENDKYDRALLEEAKFGVTLWKAVGRITDNKDSEALSLLTDLRRNRSDSPEVKYWLTVVNIRQGAYTKAKEIFDTIPAGIIPDKVLSDLKSIIHKRLRISDSNHDDIFNLRSPRMTGTASSPIRMR